MRRPILVLALLLASGSALGQMTGNPENWCREGFFTRDSKSFGTSLVKGKTGARIHFYNDSSERCPESTSCVERSYLVPGDPVITNRIRGAFACSWYSPATGAPTVGWIRLSDLVPMRAASDPSIRAWLGEWHYGDNSIVLTENKLSGNLNVAGDAMWKGLGDNVHVGEIDGRVEPKNGVLEYSDGDGEFDCQATIRLVGGSLVVVDNMKCGGMNVTFSGVYTKRAKSAQIRSR